MEAFKTDSVTTTQTRLLTNKPDSSENYHRVWKIMWVVVIVADSGATLTDVNRKVLF